MVRTKGPLLSIAAAGSLGDVLTSSSSKGRSYMKLKSSPKDTRSPRQLSIRAMVSFLNIHWPELDQEDKDLWNAIAAGRKFSVQNAYLQRNMQRWTTGTAPSDDPEEWPPDTPSTLFLYSPALVGRGPRLRVFMNVANNSVAVVFHRDPANGFTPSWSNAVHVVKITAGASVYWHDSPLASGTYRYKCRVFTHHGVFGPSSTQRTVVMP